MSPSWRKRRARFASAGQARTARNFGSNELCDRKLRSFLLQTVLGKFRKCFAGCLLPGEFERRVRGRARASGPGRRAWTTSLARACAQALESSARQQNTRVADHFRQGRRPAAQDGAAAGHRFQRRQAEAFILGRVAKRVRAAVQHGQVFVGYIAGQNDLPLRTSVWAARPVRVSVRPASRACRRSSSRCGAGFLPQFQQGKGIQQQGQVFARLQDADRQQVRFVVQS